MNKKVLLVLLFICRVEIALRVILIAIVRANHNPFLLGENDLNVCKMAETKWNGTHVKETTGDVKCVRNEATGKWTDQSRPLLNVVGLQWSLHAAVTPHEHVSLVCLVQYRGVARLNADL